MKYDVVITAGGLISGDFEEKAGTKIKALIKIKGKSILERTLQALRESRVSGRIALVAPEEMRDVPESKAVDTFIPAHKNGVENIIRGLTHYQDESRIIWCSSDLPFISSDSIRDFIERCPDDAALCYPIFEKDEIKPEISPGIPSYVRLSDGFYTGGSILRLDVKVCISKIAKIGKCFNARKSVLSMAKILGLRTVVMYLLGRCTVNDLIRRVEEILEAKCAAIRGCDSVVTFDIDDEASYEYAVKYAETHLDQSNSHSGI